MAANVANIIKKTIQELVVPDLQEIKTELRVMRSEIRRLDEKIENVDDKVEDVKEEIRNLREEFKLAIDIHERLSALEAKIGIGK